MSTSKLNSKLFFIFLIFSLQISTINSASTWNYNKGGTDWPKACKEGAQAPLDIRQPFTYKGKMNIDI